MVDDMLAAMRAGTYDVQPLPQTKAPGRTWNVEATTVRKSAGGVGVSNPNNAGGVGDRSGVIMLDRVVADPASPRARASGSSTNRNLRPTRSDGGHH